MLFPCAVVVLDVGEDVDVEVDVELGLPPVLFRGVEGLPPQPTSVRAIRMSKQIFTENSPALIWNPGASAEQSKCLSGATTYF